MRTPGGQKWPAGQRESGYESPSREQRMPAGQMQGAASAFCETSSTAAVYAAFPVERLGVATSYMQVPRFAAQAAAYVPPPQPQMFFGQPGMPAGQMKGAERPSEGQ